MFYYNIYVIYIFICIILCIHILKLILLLLLLFFYVFILGCGWCSETQQCLPSSFPGDEGPCGANCDPSTGCWKFNTNSHHGLFLFIYATLLPFVLVRISVTTYSTTNMCPPRVCSSAMNCGDCAQLGNTFC